MPDLERWERMGSLFDGALALPPERRAAWLQEACGGDAELYAEVECMVGAHEREGVLDRSLDETLGPDWETIELQPGAHVGPYEIVGEVGRGGMGVVYQARDPRLDRFVALKFLPAYGDGNQPAALAEAKAASALDHPNICTVYDVGEAEGWLYIAMAFCDGRTLASRIAEGAMPLEEALDVAIQAARGLGAAHDAGIVHRDIKPSNLVLTSKGVLKIVDFGLAELDGSSRPHHAGTVPYMSPEQAGGRPLDRRSDLWSLGVVLHEMLSGERPFRGEEKSEVIQAILTAPPPPLRNQRPDLPPAVERLVLRLLAKEAAGRYGSAGELAEELERIRRAGIAQPMRQLPAPLTSFVGRENELSRVVGLATAARLLTITGTAGAGKTRLAVEAARRLEPDFPDGVHYVSLACVPSPDLLVPAIAKTLGTPIATARPAPETVKSAISKRHMLLLLDNFEQISAAAPQVAELLEACPRLHVLATSRIALRISGEHEFRLAPLAVPDLKKRDAGALEQVPSVRLFVDRASAALAGFALTPENSADIAELCQRLDGLPLAIELAAARIKVFPPHAMLSRLSAALDLLKGGPRDRPARHQTLREALAWSYGLLSEDERKLFRRAGVFYGGFTLDGIERVAAAFGDIRISVVDALSSLVDHSLVSQREDSRSEPRFYLLAVVGEYALERLHEAGERETARRAHAGWVLEVAERAGPELTGPRQAAWLDWLDTEHENIRAALSWLEGNGESLPALRICNAVWRFWTVRGYLREGRDRLQRLLARPCQCPRAIRAHALNACATLSHGCCDLKGARARLEESVALFRELQDPGGTALALNNLAWVNVELTELAAARTLAQEALELHSRAGNKRGVAVALNNLGWIAMYQSEYALAHEHQSRSLELRRDIGDFRGVAFALANIAWAAWSRGEYEFAAGRLDEALEILGKVNDRMLLAWAKQQQGAIACERGEFETAAALLEAALPVWRQVENGSGLALTLYYAGLVYPELGALDKAASAFEEAARTVEALPQRWGAGMIELGMAKLAAFRGENAEAGSRYRHSLRAMSGIGDRRAMSEALEGLGLLAAGSDAREAVRMLAAAAQLRQACGAPVPPYRRTAVTACVEALRAALGDEFESMWKSAPGARGNAHIAAQ